MPAPEISSTAKEVLEKRYLQKGPDGKPLEDIDGMFRRVAVTVAGADRTYDCHANIEKTANAFYNMVAGLYFLPNSPTLMNAGRPHGQLSACFVLPIEDTLADIFETLKNAALVHKSGGGTGFSFSRLRPEGAAVASTGGVASGPVSFMQVYDCATEAVKQGGTRRGANMGVLRIDHPDILQFIDCKRQAGVLENFNISVGLTEGFMRAAEAGDDYELVDPSTGEEAGRLAARQVLDRLVDAAWTNGEPGILFLDRINRDNPVPSQGVIEATNPCGEQPLLPYESCTLGSVNLPKMLKETEGGRAIDWALLSDTVHCAVHFLDNVIDCSAYPLCSIANTTRATRKIGLGVMGFADMLLLLGVPYDSQEALALADRVMGFIRGEARCASMALARKRGPFPLFEESIWRGGEPMRHAAITTIAPTGTLSIIAGCSSGIEPVFAFAYTRSIMDGRQFDEVSPILRAELERAGVYSEALASRIAREGSVQGIEEIPAGIRRVFVNAHDVSPQWHVRMQGAFQRRVDNAVSKTVNLPHSATRGDVAEVFRLAMAEGCKGVTVYRDGSRAGQVLATGGGKARRAAIGEEENVRWDGGKSPAQPAEALPCPECGQALTRQGGCPVCLHCGYARCDS